MMKNKVLDLLPFLLIGDLVLPFLLAPTYRGYNHLMQVMSALGNPIAPLHILYNIWLIVLGIGILLCNFKLFPVIAEKSSSIAIMLFAIICIYAIGACILSGLFPVGETKELKTISSKIHGYGSVIGFMFLIFAPLFIGLYFFKSSSRFLGIFSLICFAFSLLCFAFFVMADKPKFHGSIIAFEGLWQRLSLLSMYLPLIALCITKNHHSV